MRRLDGIGERHRLTGRWPGGYPERDAFPSDGRLESGRQTAGPEPDLGGGGLDHDPLFYYFRAPAASPRSNIFWRLR